MVINNDRILMPGDTEHGEGHNASNPRMPTPLVLGGTQNRPGKGT
jgi:hypothetical protein